MNEAIIIEESILSSKVTEATIAKIRQMPPALVREVEDFVDFLLAKRQAASNIGPTEASASTEATLTDEALAEVGMDHYLTSLQDYEERLALGEIKW